MAFHPDLSFFLTRQVRINGNDSTLDGSELQSMIGANNSSVAASPAPLNNATITSSSETPLKHDMEC